jgi:hypothetical protein
MSKKKHLTHKPRSRAKKRLAKLTVSQADLQDGVIRKGKVKLSTIAQAYTVEAPREFVAGTPSDLSPDSGDRKHTSLTFTHVKNGVEQGEFEVPRRVSGDGITEIRHTYRDDDGHIRVDTFADPTAIIERYVSPTIGHTTHIGYICPKCGATSYFHDCNK